MSRENHLGRCKEETEKRDALISQWLTDWPNHCRQCGGEGKFIEEFDPSPPGVSLGSGTYKDEYLCGDCTACGICARCGRQGLEKGGAGPCPHCGWNYDDSLPPEIECFCWQIEADRAELEAMEREARAPEPKEFYIYNNGRLIDVVKEDDF